MKIIFFSGIIFISAFGAGRGFGADEAVTSAGKPLAVEEFIGKKDAYLEPTMFPKFYDDSAKDKYPECWSALEGLSGKDRWTRRSTAGGGWTVNKAPYSCTKSNSCKNASVVLPNNKLNYSNCSDKVRSCDSSGNCVNEYFPCEELKEDAYYDDGAPKESSEDLDENEYQLIPGLAGTIKSSKGYQNITKILLTWTVRVEGYKRLLAVWPFLCHPHHGTSYQSFPAGQLKTRLYVRSKASGNGVKDADTKLYEEDKFVPVGQIAEMTVPSAGKGKVSNIGDPTITGSYALSPSDFSEGRVSPEIDFEVRWYNETSMRIKSPANQRNLIATVFPVTNQESEE